MANFENHSVSSHSQYIAASKLRSRFKRVLVFSLMMGTICMVAIYYIVQKKAPIQSSDQETVVDSSALNRPEAMQEVVADSLLVEEVIEDEPSVSEKFDSTTYKIYGVRESRRRLLFIISHRQATADYHFDLGNGVSEHVSSDTTLYTYWQGGRFMTYLMQDINGEAVKIDSQYIEIVVPPVPPAQKD